MVACTPHPGLGTVAIQRPAIVHFVDLATCRETTERAARPALLIKVAQAHGRQSIVYHGRVVLTLPRAPGPIVVGGLSPNRRWLLFAIDPYNSASLMADGVGMRVVSTAGGRSHRLGRMLNYSDYRSWCGGRLVFTVGEDREATRNKTLEVASPPDWKPRPLTRLRGRAFGSIACAPDSRSVIVQSQHAEELTNFFSTRWQLWRIDLDGAARQLTWPPVGYADESPHLSPDGKTLYFVRSTHGNGKLYALRTGKLIGPLLSLGYSMGYYGANAWPYSVAR